MVISMDEKKIQEYINKHKNYIVYIVSIIPSETFYKEIINIFCDAIPNSLIINNINNTCLISNVENTNVNEIVNAIIDDTGINICVYKSNKLTSIKAFEIVNDMFNKYSPKINESFITNRMLIEEMFNNDIDDLNTFKPIVLETIEKDTKLFEIVNGMFVNNLNVSKTANYVYMHRNTINNKLNVIKQETGLDIQNFQDAVMLYVLIKK